MSRIFVSQANREKLAEFRDLIDEQYLPKMVARFRDAPEEFREMAKYAREKARTSSSPKIYFRFLTAKKNWEATKNTFRKMIEAAKSVITVKIREARENARQLAKQAKAASKDPRFLRRNRAKFEKMREKMLAEKLAKSSLL